MMKVEKKNICRQKGITLIALVITIIVLLILAGVAISSLTGESSIIQNAKDTVEKYNNKVEQQDIKIGNLENKLQEQITGKKEEKPNEDPEEEPEEPEEPQTPVVLPQEETKIVDKTNTSQTESFSITIPNGVNIIKVYMYCDVVLLNPNMGGIGSYVVSDNAVWCGNGVGINGLTGESIPVSFSQTQYVKVTPGKTYNLTHLYQKNNTELQVNETIIEISYSQSINEEEPDTIDL